MSHLCLWWLPEDWNQTIDPLYQQRTELTAILSGSFQLNEGSERPAELANAFPASRAERSLVMRGIIERGRTVGRGAGCGRNCGLSSGCSLSRRIISGDVVFGNMHRFFWTTLLKSIVGIVHYVWVVASGQVETLETLAKLYHKQRASGSPLV
jgi:hypothetical protein